VYDLLPLGWAELIVDLSTREVDIGDQIIDLQKVSSMGNGYTFELESLLFWAIAESVRDLFSYSREPILVYGDDIIVHRSYTMKVIDVLTDLGFTLNLDKSFWDGPFRESCGGDYYFGDSVRPFYIRDRLSYEVLFALHNFLIRNGEGQLALWVLEWIPEGVRTFGPNGSGDGHLIGSYGFTTRNMRINGYAGVLYESYLYEPKRLGRDVQFRKAEYSVPSYTAYIRSGLESPTDVRVVRGNGRCYRKRVYTLATHVF